MLTWSYARFKVWSWVFGPPLILFVGLALSSPSQEARLVVIQLLAGLAVSGFRLKRSVATWIFTVTTYLLASSAMLGYIVSPQVWWNLEKGSTAALLSSLGEERVLGSARRVWTLEEEGHLSFEVKRLSGESGWAWFASEPGIRQEFARDATGMFTRVQTPTSGDPYLMRTYDLGASTGGRTFRVNVDMRAPSPIAVSACRGVWLQVWEEGGGADCLNVALDTSWQSFSHTWTVPDTAQDSTIRVILNNFDGFSYDVRRVRLWLAEEEDWRALTPLVPEGAYLNLRTATATQTALSFLPEDAWQRYTVSVDEAGSLRATLRTSPGLELAVRNTRLDAATPNYDDVRQRLWFEHPNLAGHTVAVLGLLALSTLISWLIWLVAALAMLIALIATESHAALLGSAIGLVWLGLLRLRASKWLTVVLVVGAVVSAYLMSTQVSGFTNELSGRIDVWQVAWEAFLRHPLTGLAGSEVSFNTFWQAVYQGNNLEPIEHAHNVWLELAANHGVFGFIAALWLTVGLLYAAWRLGHHKGLIIATCLLIMNSFDYTLFYGPVFFSLILGLNALENKSLSSTLNRSKSILRNRML